MTGMVSSPHSRQKSKIFSITYKVIHDQALLGYVVPPLLSRPSDRLLHILNIPAQTSSPFQDLCNHWCIYKQKRCDIPGKWNSIGEASYIWMKPGILQYTTSVVWLETEWENNERWPCQPMPGLKPKQSHFFNLLPNGDRRKQTGNKP